MVDEKNNLSWVVGWVSAVFAFLLFIILGFLGGFRAAETSGGVFVLIAYYVQAFGFSFFESLDQLALLLFLFVVGLAFYWIMRRFGSFFFVKVSWFRFDVLETPWVAVRASAKKIGRELLDLLPAMVLLLVLSLVFSEANELDKTRLADVTIISPEHFLTGTYAFAWLGSFHWPHLVVEFIIGCFLNIATIVILPALYVGYVTPRIFREMIAAFVIGMMILAACWLAVPALSPQDRFIDNAYHLPVPAGIAIVVANYHPQPEIQDFLANIRAGKANLPDLPTSTIPSAHIFWLGLAGYYFFKSKKWLGWITLLFLAASGIGTILLAQHYLMDVITALVVVTVSVWIARYLGAQYEE